MAYVYANYSIDTDSINLFDVYAGTYLWEFWPNFSVDYYYEDDGDDFWLELYGEYIRVGASSGNMYSGTITDLYEHVDVSGGGDYVEVWGAENVSISAETLMSAMKTASTSDDKALLASMFSRNDLFELSDSGDRARGYGGSDSMYGYGGADRLYGGGNSDKLYGGAGNDWLSGDSGKDTLSGGTGSDDFVFTATSHSAPGSTTRDVITGFSKGYDDIVVSAIDAKAGIDGNQAFVLDTNGSFSRGEIRQRVTDSGLLVEFNTDSDSTAEMAILIQGLSSRVAGSDFVF